MISGLIRHAESIGLRTCIITSGPGVEKVKKLAEARCSERLLSIHGFEEQQDRILNVMDDLYKGFGNFDK